ncbi:MAG TPA: PGPGW domain-containing protein [Actinomycetota bacterium]|nr:PGPGW domain-containing protein [Actinomycetota bacterium]
MAQFGDIVVFVGRSGRRVAVTAVGFSLLGVGVVLLVVPGPGLLFIAAGLAVLATEYSWARRALEAAKQRARRRRRT